jgi:hypothetical protein
MSTFNGKSFQDPRNINLKGGVTGTGLIRWKPPVSGGVANWSANPFGTDDYGLYINTSDQLVFSSKGSTTILGQAGGGGAVPTWEQIFASDQTLATAGTTFTITEAGASTSNDVLTLTNTQAGASGNLIALTQSGTGKDILGTSSTWSVSKAGLGTFASLVSATLTGPTTTLTLAANGASAVVIGTGSNTVTIAKAATFSSTVTVSDGITSLTSTSNAANALTVVNNTVTTYGDTTASTGVARISSISLTTGTLLKLQLTEGTLTTGWYLNCYDVTGSASVFSVGKYGALVQGGAGGSTIQTITAGDFLMSDGSITVTDADNAASFSVTNNTATSNSVFVFAGSGVFTGVTTASFMTITPSGLTTGTALYIVAVGATTSVGVVDIITAGLTSGSAVRITTSTAAFTTGGKALEISLVSATAGNGITVTTAGAYAGTGLIVLGAAAMTTGTALSIIGAAAITSGKLINAVAGTTLTSGILVNIEAAGTALTGAGRLLYVNHTGAATAGATSKIAEIASAAADDTTIFQVTASAALAAGYGAVISATAMTTGTALYITMTGATITTNGKYFVCYDATAAGAAFSIGRYGATVIAGTAAATAALTLTAGDLVLTSGHIVMTSGNLTLTSGNVVLTSGTLTLTLGNAILTAGNLVLTAGSIVSTPQAIASANTAISVTNGITTITNAGATTHTLADGVSGQRKTIVAPATLTGHAVITPTNFANGTSVALYASLDAIDLVFVGGKWQVTNLYGTATIA